MEDKRDHIFISYAFEDVALAEWIARKLMSAGYAVWIDRFKLLGGDIWPDDIDNAIKHCTFRMVHLLSQYSRVKENPSKERQLGLSLSKKYKERFLIPLNVDGVSIDDIPWQLTDIQYIPFENWNTGLYSLINTLDQINCPRLLSENGIELAIRSYFPIEAIKNNPEKLFTNCFQVLKVPNTINRYRTIKKIEHKEATWLGSNKWPCYRINGNLFLSFETAPHEINKKYGLEKLNQIQWYDTDSIDGVESRNIIKLLIKRSFSCIVADKGLEYNSKNPKMGYWWIPKSILNQDHRLHFYTYSGKRTWIKATGHRKLYGERFYYYLAFRIALRDDILDNYTIQLKIRFHLTDQNDVIIEKSKIPSRRKAVTGNYWNHEWLLRQQAIMSLLSQGEDVLSWGNFEDTKVVFSTLPFMAESPVSIDDNYIDTLGPVNSDEELNEALID